MILSSTLASLGTSSLPGNVNKVYLFYNYYTYNNYYCCLSDNCYVPSCTCTHLDNLGHESCILHEITYNFCLFI